MTAAKTVESIPVRRFIIEATSIEMEAIELALADDLDDVDSPARRALYAVQDAQIIDEDIEDPRQEFWTDLPRWEEMCAQARRDPIYARQQIDHLQSVIYIHRPTSERSAQ